MSLFFPKDLIQFSSVQFEAIQFSFLSSVLLAMNVATKPLYRSIRTPVRKFWIYTFIHKYIWIYYKSLYCSIAKRAVRFQSTNINTFLFSTTSCVSLERVTTWTDRWGSVSRKRWDIIHASSKPHALKKNPKTPIIKCEFLYCSFSNLPNLIIPGVCF